MNMKAISASVPDFQDHGSGALLFRKGNIYVGIIRSNPYGCYFAHGKTGA